ncbi:MAG: 50S ribosomal protein L11 methyltransferase [Verrucomicrobia bacterium]|nr:50S ribosomal protein L11 methyltransferase [Verrucomicrobiota bacterium]
MTHGKLQQILVTVPRRLEPAFTMHLRSLAGQWPTSWVPASGDRAEISLFMPAQRGTERMLRSVRAFRDILGELGLAPGAIRVRRKIIRAKDWARAWRNSFEPVRISPTLVVKPTWSKLQAREGQVVIEIDPTLAFGTGHHPTTAFCLRMVEQVKAESERRKPEAQGPLSLLDCGCGTGILAIAAARLGYSPAIGFDYDRQAVRVARANAKLNRVDRRLEIIKSALEDFILSVRTPSIRGRSAGKFSLVTANLAADVLAGNARRLALLVWPGGTLALAGVLDRDARRVAAVFRRLGWRTVARESAGGWTSWAMRRQTR